MFMAMKVDCYNPLDVEALCRRAADAAAAAAVAPAADAELPDAGNRSRLVVVCSDVTFDAAVVESVLCSVAQILANWECEHKEPGVCLLAHVDRDEESLRRIYRTCRQVSLDFLDRENNRSLLFVSSGDEHVDEDKGIQLLNECPELGHDDVTGGAIRLHVLRLYQPDELPRSGGNASSNSETKK